VKHYPRKARIQAQQKSRRRKRNQYLDPLTVPYSSYASDTRRGELSDDRGESPDC
jgi:hypothetical protein